jgi:hypothetical protein
MPPVVGFVLTFIRVVLVVVGVHKRLMDLSRFVHFACTIFGSKLTTL